MDSDKYADMGHRRKWGSPSEREKRGRKKKVTSAMGNKVDMSFGEGEEEKMRYMIFSFFLPDLNK